MSDKILTREQLREIIEYLPSQGKAVTLFLANTGARIGETLQLRISDLNLDVKPACADIQEKYTMARFGARRIYFNRESVDAINTWLKTREGDYNDLVFGIKVGSFSNMWRRALEKAGLDERDETSKLRINVYHLHTIRKWFRTQIELSGMPEIFRCLLLGLTVNESDEALGRLTKERVREEYIKHRDAVTIYED